VRASRTRRSLLKKERRRRRVKRTRNRFLVVSFQALCVLKPSKVRQTPTGWRGPSGFHCDTIAVVLRGG